LNNKKNNIQHVAKKGLCSGCGTCSVLCPSGAIKLRGDKRWGIYLPVIDENKCTMCGLCRQVCPRISENHISLNEAIFNKEPDNFLIGNFLNCYIGNSMDHYIRFHSSSGGLITTLLNFAIDKGIIDGALVVRMKTGKPLVPDPFIARTREEIMAASKSKYCPVPINIGLQGILSSKKGERFAVVGLPCHMVGIRKAEMLNEKLREKIFLHLGIFCSHTNTFASTQFLLSKLGIKEEEIVKFDYRGEGWPGGINIELKNGSRKRVALATPLWQSFHDSMFFAPRCCLLCNDVTCELADISFGDAWLPEIIKVEKEGKSIMISRTKRGDDFLSQAASDGLVDLQPIKVEEVIGSQYFFLHLKKINIAARSKLLNIFKNKPYLPFTNANNISLYNWLSACFPIINSWIGRHMNIVMKFIPIKLLHQYKRLYYKFYSFVIKKDLGNLSHSKQETNS
jgi:coenzyme F420 hydrogenase subunit beta